MNVLDIRPSPSGITVLTSGKPDAWIMINTLRDRFGEIPVIVEDGQDQHASVSGLNAIKRSARKRVDELSETHGLKAAPPDTLAPIRLASVNSVEARAALQATKPKVVFVAGTRLINERTRQAVEAPFLVYDSGISAPQRRRMKTPFSRTQRDPQNFSASVQLLDKAAAGNKILYQAQVDISHQDTPETYPWIMAAGSRDIVVNAFEDMLSKSAAQVPSQFLYQRRRHP